LAARSKAWFYDRKLSGILDSNPARTMDVCLQCCVLPYRGPCDGPITHPEGSYRVWSD
jgi:hypothetical protein